MRAALVCLSCLVAWGFGFCRTGLWARPRPGALGAWWRPRYAQEDLVRACASSSSPEIPRGPGRSGVAMESCLYSVLQPTAHSPQPLVASR
jgi:hypothetical protein